MSASTKRTVLITGCSDGGMGAELAKHFHKAGLHVYATTRDPSKMTEMTALGIETLNLDITSDDSIKFCVAKVPRLDILVNNAGALHMMPVTDLSIPEAKKFFDLNVWGHLALIQAFLPLLLKSSKAMIVNHTTVGAHLAVPFQFTYNGSKAAMAMMTDTLRLELAAFDIDVVNLKTGGVNTNIVTSNAAAKSPLPTSSIYAPARKLVEPMLQGNWVPDGISADEWAKGVVGDLLKPHPPMSIWRGKSAGMARLGSLLPSAWFDGYLKRIMGLDKVEVILRSQRLGSA
ncbi:hypothetical protein B0A48_09610 [Cryoendolithus antarcticus]|uniref:NADPH-dependent 1-acyldihydroxyacetone phosphate reductase n=1 Tax=Cryoendolithus antarcticus TaxID=1507870 RepID=A0A1V8SZV0_9PEZI|nr:hypothetical protein B0A48_09610 [Cryoendolithus antarcticus]